MAAMTAEFLKECKTVWENFSLKEHAVAQLELSYYAGVYETQGEGAAVGPLWQAVVLSQEMQAKLNPISAFRYAEWLVMLDDTEKGVNVAHMQWLQGNGLQQLTDSQVARNLWGHFFYNDPKRQVWSDQLTRFIETPVPWKQIKVLDDLSFHPECFRHFVATLVALQLPDKPEILGISQVRATAASQLENPEFLRVVDFYAEISDTAQMAESLIELK